MRHDELNAPNILALLRANYVVHFTKVYDIFSEKGAMKVNQSIDLYLLKFAIK